MRIDLPREFNVATHFLDHHLKEGRGDKVAIECGDERVTYRQLLERVNQAGNALKKLGVRQEERVALLLLDTPEFAFCFFGAIKIGAVPVPLNTLLKAADYEYLLNHSRARVILVSRALLPLIEAIPRERLRYLENIVVVPETGAAEIPAPAISYYRLLQQNSPELAPAATSKDDAAFWLYSSGSTGVPKACVHLQHDMVVCSDLYARAILSAKEADRFFSV